MHPSIKQYKLKSNVTKENLLRAGFKEGGWQNQFKDPKVSYYAILIDKPQTNQKLQRSTFVLGEF